MLIILSTSYGLYYQRQSSGNLKQTQNTEVVTMSSGISTTTTTMFSEAGSAETVTLVDVAPTAVNTIEVASIATSAPVKIEPFLDLLSPAGGESLCIGDDYNISWKGSKEFNTIDVYLVRGSKSNSTTYPLGSFPVSYNESGENNGEGTYPWKVGHTNGGIVLQPNEVNRIILNGCYPNAGSDTSCTMILNKNAKSFSMLDCRG